MTPRETTTGSFTLYTITRLWGTLSALTRPNLSSSQTPLWPCSQFPYIRVTVHGALHARLRLLLLSWRRWQHGGGRRILNFEPIGQTRPWASPTSTLESPSRCLDSCVRKHCFELLLSILADSRSALGIVKSSLVMLPKVMQQLGSNLCAITSISWLSGSLAASTTARIMTKPRVTYRLVTSSRKFEPPTAVSPGRSISVSLRAPVHAWGSLKWY